MNVSKVRFEQALSNRGRVIRVLRRLVGAERDTTSTTPESA